MTNTTTITASSNTTANNQPMTLDELNKKVTELEEQLKVLQNKISFSGFNVISYETKSEDLTPTGNPAVKYKPEVRINHPLLNNNPDLNLFVQSLIGHNSFNVSTTYHNGYWYIETPLVYTESILQYGLADYTNITGYVGTMLNKNIEFNDIVNNGGVLSGRFYSPSPGNVFTILIFKALPNYNPALFNKQ